MIMAEHHIYKYDGFLPSTQETEDANVLYKIELLNEEVKEHLRLVLILDFSGSMESVMKHLKAATISAVELAIQKLAITIEDVILIPFGSTAVVKSNFKTIDDLKNVTKKLRYMGGTNYRAALRILVNEMAATKNDQFVAVMFSDGEPDGVYQSELDKLTKLATNRSLIFHAIGLGDDINEDTLRELTTIGSQEGYYQGIDDTEMEASMTALVDNFKGFKEVYINKKRTRNGLVICSEDIDTSIIEYDDVQIPISSFNIVNESFDEMVEKKSYGDILNLFKFILENHIRNVRDVECLNYITKHTLKLLECLAVKLSEESKSLTEEPRKKMREELNALAAGDAKGASLLQLKSNVVSLYNKQFHEIVKIYAKYITSIHRLKELCAHIQDNVHKNLPGDEVSDAVYATVKEYRDNTIAMKRKGMARFSKKLRERNMMSFTNVDNIMSEAVNKLFERGETSIDTPEFFKGYSDPITLNDFQEILLYKYGVFMLLLEVERSDYGVVAPHRTRIASVGGVNASVLDVMMQRGSGDVVNTIFDFRGVGFGNAAVPLWISEDHWTKARAVFNAFVGHAVTGNELEYTKLQGETLLALVLLHLQKQPKNEYNEHVYRMVKETLRARRVLDREKWEKVLEKVSPNDPKSVNEDSVPDIEVFFTWLEAIGDDAATAAGQNLSDEKAFTLVAEQFRRRNEKRITKKYKELRSSPVKSLSLKLHYPTVFEKYCEFPPSKAIGNRVNMARYFTKLFIDANHTKALDEFDMFVDRVASPSLKSHCSRMTSKQKTAVVLSTHKCVLFNTQAKGDLLDSLSFDEGYADALFEKCASLLDKTADKRKKSAEKEAKLMEILTSKDPKVAETELASIERNSPSWGTLMNVLFRARRIDQRVEQTNEMCAVDIPLHLELVMYTVYGSMNPEDWLPEKMVWKPDLIRRRRIKIMFPEAVLDAGLEEISKRRKRIARRKAKAEARAEAEAAEKAEFETETSSSGESESEGESEYETMTDSEDSSETDDEDNVGGKRLKVNDQ